MTLKDRVLAKLRKHTSQDLARPIDARALPTYALIAVKLVIAVILIYWFNFTFDIPLASAVAVWGIIAVSGMALRRVHFTRFGAGMEAFALLYGQGFISIPLIAAIAAFNAPWADPTLSSWDTTLGFSWHEAIKLLKPFEGILEFTYDSFLWQGWIMVFLLAFKGQIERLWVSVAASTIALIVASLVFAWAPAQAAYAFYGFKQGEGPDAALSFLTPLTYIREGGRHLTPSIISGMVSFPSYHAASAIIFIWSAWRTPLRLLSVLLNFGLLIGTISVGGHYFSDVLAGVLLAIGSIALSLQLVRTSGILNHRPLKRPTFAMS